MSMLKMLLLSIMLTAAHVRQGVFHWQPPYVHQYSWGTPKKHHTQRNALAYVSFLYKVSGVCTVGSLKLAALHARDSAFTQYIYIYNTTRIPRVCIFLLSNAGLAISEISKSVPEQLLYHQQYPDSLRDPFETAQIAGPVMSCRTSMISSGGCLGALPSSPRPWFAPRPWLLRSAGGSKGPRLLCCCWLCPLSVSFPLFLFVCLSRSLFLLFSLSLSLCVSLSLSFPPSLWCSLSLVPLIGFTSATHLIVSPGRSVQPANLPQDLNQWLPGA